MIQEILAAIGVLVLLILIIIIFLRMRDAPSNNYRKAKKHHRIAEKLYGDGSSEEAKDHYELSRHYRERAEKQEKGEL